MVNNSLTIRRFLILPFILLIFALSCVFGVIACGGNDSSELALVRMGYSVAVTYDYNGGTANNASSLRIRLAPNSLVPSPKDTGNVRFPGRTGYTFRYYCVAQEDEDGNLLRDADGNLIPGEIWDFSKDRVGVEQEEDEVTLVAQWWQNYTVAIHYGDNHGETQYINVQRDVETGSPMRTAGYYFTNFFNSETEQIAGYYRDSALTHRINVKSGYKFTDADFENSEDRLTVDLWLKSVSSSYTVINEANDFLGFDANLSGTTNDGASQIYYINDDIDLRDWQSASKVIFPREFTGEVIGNNHTISNYRISAGAASDQNDCYGIFKILGTGAKVSDIAFENVNATFNLANTARVREYRVGLFAGLVREGVTINNVSVSGTLNYTVVAGYNGLVSTESALVGHTDSGADVTGVSTEGISVTGSQAVHTADDAYIVYVRYILENGVKTLGDVYGLATVADGRVTAVSSARVEKTADNTFTVTSRRGTTTTVYTVTTADNNGIYSATVVVNA